MGGFGVLGLWATLVLTLVGAIAVALGFLWLSKRTLGENTGPTHNPSLSPFLTVVGLVFGALLGFTVVVAWEQFSSAEANVAMRRRPSRRCTGRPSRCRIPSGHSCASSFASTQRRYRVRMVCKETGGGTSDTARAAITEMYRLFGNRPASTSSPVDGEFLNQLTVLTTDRDQRVLDQEPRIPTLLWAGLIFGGVLLIAIAGFVNLSSRRAPGALAAGRRAAGLAPVPRLLARPSFWNGNRRHARTVPSRR